MYIFSLFTTDFDENRSLRNDHQKEKKIFNRCIYTLLTDNKLSEILNVIL